MKTIIAGTDFTPSSQNACLYAAYLAHKLKCKLTLFNLFLAPVVHSNTGLYGFSYDGEKKDSELKMYKLVSLIKEMYPAVKVNQFIASGSFEERLREFTGKHQIEAAVMGLEVKNRLAKFIYGSHGVNIAGKIDAPVIIVPEKYKIHTLSNVLLAVDNNEKLYKTSLRGFERFTRLSHANLNILHVRTPDELMLPQQKNLKFNTVKVEVKTMKAKAIEEGIKRYCMNNSCDLVTVISKKHSAFYNLFNESVTRKVAFASKVPVMAIHE